MSTVKISVRLYFLQANAPLSFQMRIFSPRNSAKAAGFTRAEKRAARRRAAGPELTQRPGTNAIFGGGTNLTKGTRDGSSAHLRID